jgi:hypothetical protein
VQIYTEHESQKRNGALKKFGLFCAACAVVPLVFGVFSHIKGPGATVQTPVEARYVSKLDAQLDAMTLKEHMTVIRAVAKKGDNASDNEMLDAIDHARAARKTAPTTKNCFVSMTQS